MFSNTISHDVISGNITATISDHQPQLLFALNVLSKILYQNLIFMKEIGQSLQCSSIQHNFRTINDAYVSEYHGAFENPVLTNILFA